MSRPAHADCVLSNAYWPSGSAQIGETVTLSVASSGCSSDLTVQFRIYDEDPGLDDFIKQLNAPIRAGINTVSTSITSNEWESAGGSQDGALELYFEASACIQSVCSNTATSNQIALSPDVFPEDVTTTPSPTGTSSPTITTPAVPVAYDFGIDNPLGGASDLTELIKKIGQWIFNISIPIGVIMIVVGGLQFLFAGASPAMAQRGRDTIKYAVIGLAIIFIGYGFVTLVQSIIKLGDSTPTPTPNITTLPQ